MISIINGDCLQELPKLAASGEPFHACVTDPPYHLTSIVKRFGGRNAAPAKHGTDGAFARASRGFMGQTWDGGDVAANPETWRAVYDCLLPGAHLVAFGGTRTYHRMACAIEDAGFEIRDTLMWLYGSGFPKSHDVSKGIDKAAGAEREVVGATTHPDGRPRKVVPREAGVHDGGHRLNGINLPITAPGCEAAAQWAGWGTALKPAVEPIILARKPLIGTVVATVLKHGTGALNIDASRIGTGDDRTPGGATGKRKDADEGYSGGWADATEGRDRPGGARWPANLLHDGSDEVLEAFAAFGESSSPEPYTRSVTKTDKPMFGGGKTEHGNSANNFGDSGTAARFFFCAKADATDRAGSKHPTVKPTELMRWLVRLITPPGGTVLDPFAGSGSTLLAADQLGFSATGIEMDPTFAADARRKVAADAGMFAEIV